MSVPIQTESDAFYRYLYFVFNPAVLEAGNGVIMEEPSVGTLYWSVKGKYKKFEFDTVYASPCWENEINKISVAFFDCDSGEWETGIFIDFPMNNWTMDVHKDVERYCLAVRKYLKETFGTKLPPFCFGYQKI